GISMVPQMARKLDQSDRRVYRSMSGIKPVRKIAMVWNPYRFQSRLLQAFQERLRTYARQQDACPS
ncbi:MAG: hyalin, partial [Gimesia chilikensis]